MKRPNRYPYTKSQWEEKTTTAYIPVLKVFKSNTELERKEDEEMLDKVKSIANFMGIQLEDDE